MYDSGGRRSGEGAGGYAPTPALQALTAAVERFSAAPEPERTPEELGGDLKRQRHLIDLLELKFSQTAAMFAETEAYEQDGSISAEDWIRHECHTSGVAAHSAINVGQQLDALPQTAAAVHDGRIGYAHLAMVASTARAVTEPVRPGDAPAPFDEQPLLDKALEHSVGRFRHDCAHARHAADAAGFLADHLSDVEWRAFELVPCEGGVVLRGRLDTVGGATLRTALEPLAKRAGAEDQRRRKRRLADALVELSHHGLDAGVLPSQGGQRPHLQVTTTVETLMGMTGAPAGELQFSSPIPAATVQRLACDSGVTRVVFGAGSAITNVGRRLRVPSGPMRRALQARDQGCVWPGCERPVAWTNAHHVKHWARDDGETELPNLRLVCIRHHCLLHEGGWNMVLTDDGRVLTIPPRPDAPAARGPSPPTADEEEWRGQHRRVSQWELLHPEGPQRDGPVPRR